MRMSVEVDIDVDDVLDDLDDEQLRKAGLIRTAAKPPASAWHDVQGAIRRGDQRQLHDILSGLAWDQAGVILPVGIPVIH